MAEKVHHKSRLYEPVPLSAVYLYRMVWQLETWLRTFVYVELRAAQKDWQAPIKQIASGWPPKSLTNDKTLHHMATRHRSALSYLTLGELWGVVSDTSLWPLFQPYFPPKENVTERIKEVKAIRNRVAHFREPHSRDVTRMELFLQDMEPGIRAFCERYCTGKRPATKDSITERLRADWSHVGYGVELLPPNGDWLYAPHPHRGAPLLHCRLELLTHQNWQPTSEKGAIYRLVISPKRNDRFDLIGFVEATARFHEDIIHIIPGGMCDEVVVTIPAILECEAAANLIGSLIGCGLDATRTSSFKRIEEASAKWPEYILAAGHLFSFFDAEIGGNILDLEKP